MQWLGASVREAGQPGSLHLRGRGALAGAAAGAFARVRAYRLLPAGRVDQQDLRLLAATQRQVAQIRSDETKPPRILKPVALAIAGAFWMAEKRGAREALPGVFKATLSTSHKRSRTAAGRNVGCCQTRADPRLVATPQAAP
jgi:hypothetical protein